jgi:hypothetical protein
MLLSFSCMKWVLLNDIVTNVTFLVVPPTPGEPSLGRHAERTA